MRFQPFGAAWACPGRGGNTTESFCRVSFSSPKYDFPEIRPFSGRAVSEPRVPHRAPGLLVDSRGELRVARGDPGAA